MDRVCARLIGQLVDSAMSAILQINRFAMDFGLLDKTRHLQTSPWLWEI